MNPSANACPLPKFAEKARIRVTSFFRNFSFYPVPRNFFFPPSDPAAGFFDGHHPKSKFRAVS